MWWLQEDTGTASNETQGTVSDRGARHLEEMPDKKAEAALLNIWFVSRLWENQGDF